MVRVSRASSGHLVTTRHGHIVRAGASVTPVDRLRHFSQCLTLTMVLASLQCNVNTMNRLDGPPVHAKHYSTILHTLIEYFNTICLKNIMLVDIPIMEVFRNLYRISFHKDIFRNSYEILKLIFH